MNSLLIGQGACFPWCRVMGASGADARPRVGGMV